MPNSQGSNAEVQNQIQEKARKAATDFVASADLLAALKVIHILEASEQILKKLEKDIAERVLARAKAARDREAEKARVEELKPGKLLASYIGLAIPDRVKRGRKPQTNPKELTVPATGLPEPAKAPPDDIVVGKSGVSGE